MNKKIIPTYVAKSIFDIDLSKIIDNDFNYVFVDLDNTLANPYVYKADNQVKQLIEEFKKLNINIIVLSNNHEKRVKDFCEELFINYIYEVKKPSIKKLKSYLFFNNIKIENCLVIGDQIMTDILMANKLHIKNILVDPLTKQDEPITFIPRLLDKLIRIKLKKKKLTKEF